MNLKNQLSLIDVCGILIIQSMLVCFFFWTPFNVLSGSIYQFPVVPQTVLLSFYKAHIWIPIGIMAMEVFLITAFYRHKKSMAVTLDKFEAWKLTHAS